MQTTFGTFFQLEHVHHKLPTKYDDFLQPFSSYWSNEEELPARTLFQEQSSTYLSEKKLLFFTLQMNDIYWKRRTMTVAFQRLFGILERWNNNQVSPSLSKPHELSYRSNTKSSVPIYSVNVKFINLWNVAGAVFKPKGILSNS